MFNLPQIFLFLSPWSLLNQLHFLAVIIFRPLSSLPRYASRLYYSTVHSPYYRKSNISREQWNLNYYYSFSRVVSHRNCAPAILNYFSSFWLSQLCLNLNIHIFDSSTTGIFLLFLFIWLTPSHPLSLPSDITATRKPSLIFYCVPDCECPLLPLVIALIMLLEFPVYFSVSSPWPINFKKAHRDCLFQIIGPLLSKFLMNIWPQ